MNLLALKMLIGSRGKYIGMIFGVALATFLMCQQGSIFWGLMSRTAAFIADTAQPDIWVMDPKVQFVDDVKPLQDTMLQRVRGVEGVQWAVPMYRRVTQARLTGGSFQSVTLIGVDTTSLIGGPAAMVEGRLEDLRKADAVIVDLNGASERLRVPLPDGTTRRLELGDTLELNDRRAVVVGFCRALRTFQNQPVIYTTFNRALQFAPLERRTLSYILVDARPGVPVAELTRRIKQTTGLSAYSQEQFYNRTWMWFFRNTGIPINFGISVALGFFVGAAICGQTFYQFTTDNLRNLGALKAMGVGNWTMLRMVVLQALVVGVVGYGLGLFFAGAFGIRIPRDGNLAFLMAWWIPVLAGVAVLMIVSIAAVLSLWKVIRLEPGIVFR